MHADVVKMYSVTTPATGEDKAHVSSGGAQNNCRNPNCTYLFTPQVWRKMNKHNKNGIPGTALRALLMAGLRSLKGDILSDFLSGNRNY